MRRGLPIFAFLAVSFVACQMRADPVSFLIAGTVAGILVSLLVRVPDILRAARTSVFKPTRSI